MLMPLDRYQHGVPILSSIRVQQSPVHLLRGYIVSYRNTKETNKQIYKQKQEVKMKIITY